MSKIEGFHYTCLTFLQAWLPTINETPAAPAQGLLVSEQYSRPLHDPTTSALSRSTSREEGVEGEAGTPARNEVCETLVVIDKLCG